MNINSSSKKCCFFQPKFSLQGKNKFNEFILFEGAIESQMSTNQNGILLQNKSNLYVV